MRRNAGRARRAAATLVAFAALLVALPQSAPAAVEPPRSTAGPADPGRWTETGFSPVSAKYFQGITSSPDRDLYFDGPIFGLYRTDDQLNQTAGVDNEIPADVGALEGYNHIGDLSWDDAEGGRVLLPLECYYPVIGNFCGTGSIGVADPDTLAWRYYVKLDPADIKKAMWVEASPDGSLLWTSEGRDLLAYAASDVNPANAAPGAAPIKPVRKLAGAVPPNGVTGATFYRGRLLLANQSRRTFQVWSVDTDTGEGTLEIDRLIDGESEGLDIFDGFGGPLHWQVAEVSFTGLPTYGSGRNAILHFAPVNHPPDCSGVHPSRTSLWPPLHWLAKVVLEGATDPDGDPLTLEVKTVTQDERLARLWFFGTLPDAFRVKRKDAVLLRAKRNWWDDGRVYRISYEVSDGAGGSCAGEVTVGVPRKRGGTATDSSPPSYDSFGPKRHSKR